MYLSKNINYRLFLQSIQECKGNVSYVTKDGDQLNLKSELCKYLFISAIPASGLLDHGQVICSDTADYLILKPYLREEE